MKKKAQNITLGVSAVLLIAVMTFYFFSQSEESKREKTVEASPLVDYWEMFAGISLKRKFIEEADAYYRVPIFTPILLDYTGKEVTLSGYYLPYSRIDSVIIISRFPNASCFFCGKAGIESVAMVELGEDATKSYQTDQKLIVKGELVLNATNFKKLAFVIANATVEEAVE